MNAARTLYDRISEHREVYTRQPFDAPRDGTCDACAITGLLVAAWHPTKWDDGEPWLCAGCDREARDEDAAVNALPAIADHGDAVKAYREHRRGYGTQHTCDRCTSLLRAVFTTWGAVAAALTGEES